ncbi:putative uncharacterized protein DDB_G0285119 [Stomoxys calcitrans]|uniref:putative uncharacterized protein DDB_G0285119 n=1 Tax=Stomoxys calcitrans TaxID=35570 RepID=UPI0027E3210E|nr:putative uncharacterized protein DDB_G0285119 [Stomoxys calcitrans]
MLNDISGDSSSNFNFHLSSSLSQNKLKSLLNSKSNDSANDSQPLTSVRECGDDKCLDSKSLLISVSTNGADNLSWKFFEHVDTLDHQLRNDESSPPAALLNGTALSSSNATSSSSSTSVQPAVETNDVGKSVNTTMSSALGMQVSHNYNSSIPPPTQPPLPHGNNRKSNGYAINGTLLQPPEILSQTSSATAVTATTSNSAAVLANDLNKTEIRDTRVQSQQQHQQQPLQHSEGGSTFVFTSPTSTFKRKKQQQLLKEEELQNKSRQYEQLQNNNNNNTQANNGYGLSSATKRPPLGSNESATTLSEDYSNSTTKGSPNNLALIRHHWGQLQPAQQHNSHYQHQPQEQPARPYYQQHRSNNGTTANDTKTVINSNTGVIITDTSILNYASTSSTSSLIASGKGTAPTENGNGTTANRSTRRTHTLPLAAGKAATAAAITKLHQPSSSSFIADGVVDLVHDTKCAPSASTSSSPPHLKSNFKTKSSTATTSTKRHLNTSTTATVNNSRQQHLTAKMQASSSGGSGTTTTAKGFSNTSSLVDDIEMNLGLIGWRKKCLYTLLVLLMLLIIINLGLTLWILKVMEFSTEGMGPLKIVPGGIQLSGQALIMDMLRASSIRSRHGQPISIESSRNFSINTRGPDGLLENHLFLGHDKLECLATSFRINDTNGRNLFSVNRDEVTIGAHALRVEGEGGAIFRESIQTPHVRAEPGRELRLESPTRQLEMKAAQEINLQSRAGGIEITALEDIKLTTLEGSLRFESSKIFMPNLRTVPPIQGAPQKDHTHRVFQLCACSNGKLFLASSHSSCAGDDSTVCR